MDKNNITNSKSFSCYACESGIDPNNHVPYFQFNFTPDKTSSSGWKYLSRYCQGCNRAICHACCSEYKRKDFIFKYWYDQKKDRFSWFCMNCNETKTEDNNNT